MKNVKNMKNTQKEMTVEFKKRYAEVSAKAKAVKAKLKEALKDAKELSKDAKALYKFGNDRLYSADGCASVRPAFKGLGDKMDRLNHWDSYSLEIVSAVNNL